MSISRLPGRPVFRSRRRCWSSRFPSPMSYVCCWNRFATCRFVSPARINSLTASLSPIERSFRKRCTAAATSSARLTVVRIPLLCIKMRIIEHHDVKPHCQMPAFSSAILKW